MLIVVLLVLVFLLVMFPVVRCALMHPFKSVYYAVKDFINYIRRREWNVLKTGEIVCFCGMFGRGKTLSVVHEIVACKYMKKNGKMVWCSERKKLVPQRVHIISNVELKTVPYERLVSLEQIVLVAERMHDYDIERGCKTVVLVLGDEFSVQMNSRNFKTNIDPLLLNTILTCRHHNIALYLTSQRFNHMDALMRQVTLYVVQCYKVWRYQVMRYYDAWDMECASNPQNIKECRLARVWFVRDKDYNAYDTLACVDNLKKDMREGAMMSEEEILALQQNAPADMDRASTQSRKFAKKFQKRSK